jgi:hypothetical protein
LRPHLKLLNAVFNPLMFGPFANLQLSNYRMAALVEFSASGIGVQALLGAGTARTATNVVETSVSVTVLTRDPSPPPPRCRMLLGDLRVPDGELITGGPYAPPRSSLS